MQSQNELVEYLVKNGTLKTPRIIEAFKAVDRADFVLEQDKIRAYSDYPISIGHEATISQPTTVAIMFELLQPDKENNILDVGSGSGWTSAMLGHIVGKDGTVTAKEIIPELVQFGKNNLAKYDMHHVQVSQAGPVYGVQGVLFDKILVSASATSLPNELVDQLIVAGRMVIPIQSSIWRIDKVSVDKIDKLEMPGFAFVPLVKNE